MPHFQITAQHYIFNPACMKKKKSLLICVIFGMCPLKKLAQIICFCHRQLVRKCLYNTSLSLKLGEIFMFERFTG